MRADRLLSLLLLLQTRGQMTAQTLAKELEVSERTIYRDIDALSCAGVPVYGEPGPEGGYALIDSFRTNLTGLTEGEVRALFMLTVPAPLADLGVSQELRTALLKLSAALPQARRHDESWIRQRFHLDATWWQQSDAPFPHLQTIHTAVLQDRKLHIVYETAVAVKLDRIVSPYGLVAKAGIWYLVSATADAIRVHRVSDLLDVCLSDEPFTRQKEFDLAAFWRNWCAAFETHLSDFAVTVRVAPSFVPILPKYFGSAVRAKIANATPDTDGWIKLELTFKSFEAARERLLGFGRGVEVLEPRALQRSILDYAEQIVALYTH
ncbi:MAG: WYL domain-containing protein [Chloroflexi bacterium]|nr:WYL domain-containing protein [Chloroflexota bacterium]